MLGSIKKTAHILVYAVFLFALLFGIAKAEERIIDYDVRIEVYEDSSFMVRETIKYDFGNISRHGIFRDIPVKYDDTTFGRVIDIDVESITRDGFDEEYRKQRIGDDVRFKIGKSDFTISGEHVYRITYTVKGAFNGFDDFDELYWNAIPHGWNVPIEHVSIEVLTPGRIIETSCFEGAIGSTDPCNAYFARANVFTAETVHLAPQNGMTFAIALKKGVVTLPSTVAQVWWWLTTNFFLLIPLFVFIYMYRLWSAKGRDAKGGTIIAQYEAPLALTPIFVGSIVDGMVNNSDITADIIFLAEQGFISITRFEEQKFLGNNVDYRLEWIGDLEDLQPKERLVAELLFNVQIQKGEQVLLSELQKDRGMQHRRKKLADHIDKQLKSQGYFANRPQQTRERWLVAPIFVGVFVFVFWTINIALALALLLSSVIVIVFGLLMPKRTYKGAEMRDKILGFKEFLKITEEERLAFHNAPERGPTEFMQNLPYAIALGVEKKWADQFAGIHLPQPRWFHGAQFDQMTSHALMSELSTFNTSMSAGVSASQGGSGTSGGGFSGGGMGGGGGGSW